jgi:hypothetical protein
VEFQEEVKAHKTKQKKGKDMKHISTGFRLIAALAFTALAAVCANTRHTENLLSAAGFRTVIANTPQRQEQLKTAPPNKVTLVQRNGKTTMSTPIRLTTRSLSVAHPSIKVISSSVWPVIWPRINLKPPN